MSAVNPVVAVPLHRLDLRAQEVAALRRLLAVLGNHRICILLPDRLRSEAFQSFLQSVGVGAHRADPLWLPDARFRSVRTYNRFLLEDAFYALFEGHSHVLIYQPDAWVFEDRLTEFCESAFDYFGAPWFAGLHRSTPQDPLLDIAGNGGFSLRRVTSCREVLQHRRVRIESFLEMGSRLDAQHRGLHRAISFALQIWSWSKKNTLATTGFPAQLQEDMFWARYARRLDSGFRPAPLEDSLRFSWECNPRRLFEMTGGRLPFGCHAWARYDPDFWAAHIRM